MEKIEVFELVIDMDDESGNSSIALVDYPATESNFLAFSKQAEYNFAIKDEEKRIIEGYAMVSGLLIPRVSSDGKKFFVKFSAKTIEAIREKQSRLGLNNSFNLMHDPNRIAKGVYMLDNLIIDNGRGKIAPKEFEKVPDGSLWISAKIDDDEIWQSVLDGKFRGFSVEGMYKQTEPVPMSEDVIEKIRQEIQNFEKTVKENIQLNNKQTIESMSLKVIEDLKAILFKEDVQDVVIETPVESKFVAAELADGTVVNIEPGLEEGANVTVEVEGEVAPIPDGEYPLADGTVISIMGGVIASIKEVEAEADEDMDKEVVAPTETVTEAKIRKIIESTETVFSKVESLENELKEIKEEFTAYKVIAEDKEKAFFSAVEELASTPSVEPTPKKKSGFMTSKPLSWQERKQAHKNNNKK